MISISQVLRENSITKSEQVPDSVFQEIFTDLALRGCTADDAQNNLLRILILMQQADDNMRSLFIEKFIHLIFTQTDEFSEALNNHLLKLNQGLLSKPTTKEGE